MDLLVRLLARYIAARRLVAVRKRCGIGSLPSGSMRK